ncbi:VanW family protein [Candidatus Peregrinibacteria bacterium]|nr:VanW family protein [Candidatus Peregrinibacteria bacterium]MBT7484041.1 VanW family protein [Candidatus Peregrinibacteria bacterium]MBT7703500.1 VanW family protein [Candidatus Peregrinibacteria bacterium]
MAKPKITKNYFLSLTFLGVLVGSTAMGFGVQYTLAGKVAPGTFAANTNISFQDAEQAQEDLSAFLDEFEEGSIDIVYKNSMYRFGLDDLGLTLLKTDTVESIPVIKPVASLLSIDDTVLGGKEIGAQFDFDQEQMEANLAAKIINLNVAAEEPRITWNSALEDFEFTEEQTGWEADLDGFTSQLTTQITAFNLDSIEITANELIPSVTKAELEAQKDDLTDQLTQNIDIFTEEENWEINWLQNLHLLDFEPVYDPIKGPLIDVQVDQDLMQQHLEQYIAPKVEIAAEEVTILVADDGHISFDGTAVHGLGIDYTTFYEYLNYALNNGLARVEIPIAQTQAKVYVPAELRELGITELVADGYSSFYGSPYNRIHNIRTAIERFDGVLIAPGEMFSFGDQLGVVDGSTGYAKELVIKEGETLPEYGGGICQVSSTLFRAIMFGGFPINERRAHSYAVSYYAYPLGWGLDATVYPPAVDLKFTNDTENHILMEAYTDGYLATFKFYGTKDGRAVSTDGPYISNRAGAPPAIYEVTSELAPGEIEQVDSAHSGFTASWNRQVTYPVGHHLYPDGAIQEEPIISPYTPWPAKYLVGEGTEGYE